MTDDTHVRKRPSGLGRGLSALLGETRTEAPVASGRAPSRTMTGIDYIAIADIQPNPDQPRRFFDEAKLAELAESIAKRGLVQPIVLRPHPDEEGYQIVAGERRWRAAQRAGLHQIPAIVRNLDYFETLEIALLENIQRAELSPIEEAQAYEKLMAEFGHTQEALAKVIGKSRSHVTNHLRLLELPWPVRDQLASGAISMGHARALVGMPDAITVAARIERDGLSVRQVEALKRSGKSPPRDKPVAGAAAPDTDLASAPNSDADIAAVETHLGDLLGLKVRIAHGPAEAGAVTLNYSSLDQLDMICQRLTGEGI